MSEVRTQNSELLTLSISSIIFAPAEGPPFSACPQENYKLEGVDVEVTASVAGWEACSELCRRRKDCSHWSYDKSDIQCVSRKYISYRI